MLNIMNKLKFMEIKVNQESQAGGKGNYAKYLEIKKKYLQLKSTL